MTVQPYANHRKIAVGFFLDVNTKWKLEPLMAMVGEKNKQNNMLFAIRDDRNSVP